ncbi:MAG: signal peptide peptidase SppA [Anaerolineae bacterium]
MSRTGKIALAVAALVVLSVFACVVVFGVASVISSSIGPGGQVGIVRVEGVISTGSGVATMGSAATDARIIADLERAARDGSVAAVVLAINSPGGSVYASDRIYSAIAEMEKPVVAYFGETAASGGYYIACGADRIVAHPTSLTGSIGVISEVIVAERLLDRIGITIEVIKSAEHKDMGSYARALTPDERAILQEMVDEDFNRFVDIIVSSRNLPREQVLAVADGRVFTGTRAVELGLADSTGDFDDAVALAGELAGLSGTPNTVELTSAPSLFESLFSAASAIPDLISRGGTSGPVMQYRMAP